MVKLADARVEARALLLDGRRGPDRALQPVGLGVQRGDLLVGGADCGAQTDALGRVRVARSAERAACRARQRVESLGDVAALRSDVRGQR